jgi:hypothetical protein
MPQVQPFSMLRNSLWDNDLQYRLRRLPSDMLEEHVPRSGHNSTRRDR